MNWRLRNIHWKRQLQPESRWGSDNSVLTRNSSYYTFPGYWNWHSFWELTALISIMLAVVNILPIPALDGGHVLFLLYEVVTRRKPGEKFMEYAQITGMIFIFGLFILANVNDIIKFFG